MSLRALRDSVQKTQGDVALATAMSQPQLSRFEGRRDHLISTVRRYVRALGGEIEVVAVISGRRIPSDRHGRRPVQDASCAFAHDFKGIFP
jgi:predicted transcriptional regulator